MSRRAAAPRAFVFAARLARREVRRRPFRTLLVALLVALPVTGMTVVGVLLRTNDLTPADEWRQVRGRADAVVHGSLTGYRLPPGTRTTPVRQDHLALRTATGVRQFAEFTDLAPADPVAEGMYLHVAGRSPERPGEALLSHRLAKALGVGIGDRLELVRPSATTLTVVGLADQTARYDGHLVVLARSADFPMASVVRVPEGSQMTRVERVPAQVHHLVDLPDDLPAADVPAWARAARASYASSVGKGLPDSLSLSPALVAAAEAPVPGAPRTDAGYVPPPSRGGEQVAWSWVAGAGVLAVVGIVIASAFAAGSRRQLTVLGQLAANGAGQRVLRRVLLLQGTWTGVVGAVLGVAGGALVLALLAPHRYALLGRDPGPYDVRPLELVPVVVMAVLTATLAALVPARTASGTPVLNALAGRRPLGAVPRWLAPAGLATSAAGLTLLALAVIGAAGSTGAGPGGTRVWAVTGGIGAVAILLGSCAVAPRYVSVLDRAGTRLRGPWRFAARSLARQRTRTAAVVSAVCVTTALSVSAAAFVMSATEQRAATAATIAPNVVHLRSGEQVAVDGTPGFRTTEPPAALVSAILREVPGSVVVRVPRVLRDGAAGDYADVATVVPARRSASSGAVISVGSAAVATPDAVRLYRLDDTATRELATVGAVAFAPTPGHVALPAAEGEAVFTVRVLSDADYPVSVLPALLVTPERARALGWRHHPVPAFAVEAPRPLTAAQRAGVSDAHNRYVEDQADLSGAGVAPMVDVHYFTPRGGPDPLAVQAMLAAGALLFTVVFVAISLALASAETRDERDALSVVGAGTRVLRRTSGRKALIVTVLGATLGVPVGLLPVAVFTRVDAEGLGFVVPWAVLALLLVVVPVVAGAVTTVASGLALRVRPVRVSTMTFD